MHILHHTPWSAQQNSWITAPQVRTLYQCFFTLPSVLCGNVLAISLQLLPASLNVLSRCSSAGVHGVFVRPFFATGLGSCACEGPAADGSPRSCGAKVVLVTRPGGALVKVLLDEPDSEGSPPPPSSEARRLRVVVGERVCWAWACCCCESAWCWVWSGGDEYCVGCG